MNTFREMIGSLTPDHAGTTLYVSRSQWEFLHHHGLIDSDGVLSGDAASYGFVNVKRLAWLWKCSCGATQWGNRVDGDDLHLDWHDGDPECNHDDAELVDEDGASLTTT